MGFSLIRNHPFLDGNDRTGHAAMETFLMLNGYEIAASTDEQESVFQGPAAGRMAREGLVELLHAHLSKRSTGA
jgi:death on curing protein